MKKIIALTILLGATLAWAQANTKYTCMHSEMILDISFAPAEKQILQAVSLDVRGMGDADGSYTFLSGPECTKEHCVGEVLFVQGPWIITLGNDVAHRGTYGYVILHGPLNAETGLSYICGK